MDYRIENYRELKSEAMVGWDSYDRWGSAMSLWFDVCDELTRRQLRTPARWEYRAGPLGDQPRHGHVAWALSQMSAPSLYRMGYALQRLTRHLRALGEDY